MEESTASKIVVSSSNSDKLIDSHIHTSQLENKFGGSVPEREAYWPPMLPEGGCLVDSNPTKLVHPEEYRNMYYNGKLNGCTISPYLK